MPEPGIYEMTFSIDEDSPSLGPSGTVPEAPSEIIGEHWLRLQVLYDLYDVQVGYVSEDNPAVTLLASRFVQASDTLQSYLTDSLPSFLTSNLVSWRDEDQAGWRVRLWPVLGDLATIGYEVVVEIERRGSASDLTATCQLNLGFPTWTAEACSINHAP